MASDTACNAYIQVPILPIDAFHDALHVGVPVGAFGVLLQQCVTKLVKEMCTPHHRASADQLP